MKSCCCTGFVKSQYSVDGRPCIFPTKYEDSCTIAADFCEGKDENSAGYCHVQSKVKGVIEKAECLPMNSKYEQ